MSESAAAMPTRTIETILLIARSYSSARCFDEVVREFSAQGYRPVVVEDKRAIYSIPEQFNASLSGFGARFWRHSVQISLYSQGEFLPSHPGTNVAMPLRDVLEFGHCVKSHAMQAIQRADPSAKIADLMERQLDEISLADWRDYS